MKYLHCTPFSLYEYFYCVIINYNNIQLKKFCVIIAAMLATNWGRSKLSILCHKIGITKLNISFLKRNFYFKKVVNSLSNMTGSNQIMNISKKSLANKKKRESPIAIDIDEEELLIENKNKNQNKNNEFATHHIQKELFQPELFGGNSTILANSMIQMIHKWLPLRYNWLDWNLIFKLSKDGSSMITFYDKCYNSGPTILIVKDNGGYIFGVFLNESWTNKPTKFFGGGDTFVFRVYPNPKKFGWKKGGNRFFVLGQNDGITIGGGEHVALRLQNNLSNGISQHSDTFDNSVLSSSEDFKVVSLEVWGLKY